MVAAAAIGNIGSSDPECRGTPFPTTDIPSMIASEIQPPLQLLKDSSHPAGGPNVGEVVKMLREIPDVQKSVLQSTYGKHKAQAEATYGRSGKCSSVSSMVSTLLQQKRIALRDIGQRLKK